MNLTVFARQWLRHAVPLRTSLLAMLAFCSVQARGSDSDRNSDAAVATPAGASSASAAVKGGDEPIVLSPFTVSSEADKGYKATNTISGTRLDSKIKDLPMPIEVITAEFIKDTGATSLRDALKYSAGIQLQSQNDYAGNGLSQYSNPGGVNNPNMQTANKTDTSVVIRGFTTDNALRDGFRRKVTTDAVNVDRIEVVRGPAALLYGIGNFGGVVNYLIKTPQKTEQTSLDVMFGSHGLIRGSVDQTGPLGDKLGYRLNAAYQENGDYTDYYKVRKYAIAPIFVYRPWAKTEITLDTEYGRNLSRGTGFQSIRARADAIANDGREEHAGFIQNPGQDLRTMRWSGPDTYLKSYQGNLEFKVTQNILEGLDLLAGYDHSSVTFDSRDVSAGLAQNVGPQALWSTVIPVPLDAERGDTDANWAASPMTNSIISYSWKDAKEGTRADQMRVELSYHHTFFADHRWLAFSNNLLVGVATERDATDYTQFGLDALNSASVNYKSAADTTPFRYATQGDGSPSLPLKLNENKRTVARETGQYFVYQGKFLKDRVTLLAGLRRDTNGASVVDTRYKYADGSIDTGLSTNTPAVNRSTWTSQIGISIAPIKELSFYAMESEGLNPNFQGTRDLTGNVMPAVKATDREFGVKFDLLNGRISGTISHYKITRTGQPNTTYWWAPQTANRKFDPSKPVVYNVTDVNPDAAHLLTNSGSPLLQWNNNYAYFGDLSQYSSVPAGAAGATATLAGLQSYRNDGLNAERTGIQTAWTNAKTAGAVSYWDPSGNAISESAFNSLIAASGSGSAYATINASTAAGAAYMDSLFQYARDAGTAHPGSDNWLGWLWGGTPNNIGGYNNASQDLNSYGFGAAQTDRNEGWDGQLIITPNDDWQILFSFEKNNHTILSLGEFPTYPDQDKDRWAQWMFANGQWGLFGYYGKNEQYADESDTSTYQWKGSIYPGAQGMDYPRWSWSVFTTYRLTPLGLKGLRLGGGALRTGPQEYESGRTHAGDALKDASGNAIIMDTEPRWTFNVFAAYEFTVHGYNSYVRLNVDNVADDKKKYGLLYAPGRSFSLSAGTHF
jgi:iron complex outermembrane recepter protein